MDYREEAHRKFLIYLQYKDGVISASRARELLGFKTMEEFNNWFDKIDS